jgi:PAS domain S-box-containing protein
MKEPIYGSFSADESSPWSNRPPRAAADFWTVYEAHANQVQRSLLDWARSHREVGAFIERAGGPELQQEMQRIDGALRQAAAGDWASCHATLRHHGSVCAQNGVTFGSVCQGARAFSSQLTPHLFEVYGGEPARLISAQQALSEFVDHCIAVISGAYLDCKEAQIRAREEDLATTLDSIGDAVIVTNEAGQVMRMNPVAERLTGVTRTQCVGIPLSQVFRIEHEDTGEPVESPVPRVLREGVVVGLANHTVLVARDGTRRPIADSGAPVRGEDGEIRGVVLVFRDVTEERRAEEALRHWERIFQHATWGVATASLADVRFQAVNPAYAAMHGYTVDELLGAPVSMLWAPETQADMHRHAAETHEHGRLVVETTHLCKDGSRLPVEVIGTTLKDPSGKPTAFVANVQDITERRRLQQSRDRAIELEAENRRIEEANRLKSEFLASMSHELRTPLNSIIGFAELLHDEQVGTVTPKQREFLGDILGSGLHLLRLINDVLDLTKVEAGKMEFRPESVDLAPLAHTVVQSLRAMAVEKRLQVDVFVDRALKNIVLDPARFKQVLYNYVSNALRFTPDGGKVGVRILPEGDEHLRLEVEDSGMGISADNIERLFVAFQQLDSGAAKLHAGTGLGLALTKQLAEAQGGTVGVRSTVGTGSVFFAVLPRGPKATVEAIERRSDLPQTTSVLVIEDDPKDQAILVRILRKAGYEVEAVSNCAEAASAWKERAYDAITLDVLLPDGEDCRALLELIRKDDRKPNVPVLAMTMVADRQAAAGFAVTDVLTKPVEAGALLSALEQGGAPPSRGRPVFVVDDDAGSLKLMQAMLEKLGYDALCFSDAENALRSLDRIRPTAVIVDIIMPDMDGFAFLERFRAAPANRWTPVMVWTVKDLSVDERRSLHAAANAIVQKGVGDGSRLSAALESFLPARPAVAEQRP